MKRLFSLFRPVLTLLPFRRKQVARDTLPADSAPEASVIEAQPAWLARLKQAFRRRHAGPAPVVEADGEAAEPRSGFLARLAGRLRRQPMAETVEAGTDAAVDEAGSHPDGTHEADDAAPAGGLARVRAALANRRVWIPAAGIALATLVATLGALLWQTARENVALQAKLHAVEKERRQAGPAAGTPTPPVAEQTPPARVQVASGTAIAATDKVTRPPAPQASADCAIRDAESVALRLRDCIDAFNGDAPRPRPQAPR